VLGAETPLGLVDEIEGHLRALLRDVLCGYLDADLKAVADDILIESHGEPLGEIEARDLRREPDPAPEPRFERQPDTEPVTFEPELEYDYEDEYDYDDHPAPDYEAAVEREPDTAEMEPVTVAPQPVQHELDGVTESADWGWDDPDDFSAPV
jgi:hypothetical protein